MAKLALHVPKSLRRGKLRAQEEESVESGVALISLMSRSLGLQDLGQSSVLDVGCGCKFTQAMLDRDLPVGRYVGVDVYQEMIDFLDSNVEDSRFSFHHLNTHNEMYNPEGEPLSATTQLPVGDEKFDIICLFSVFTHLAPHDYVAMLKMLRQHIKPEGQLIFSLFVNESTTGGHGHIDGFLKALEAHDPATQAKLRQQFMDSYDAGGMPDFQDAYPDRPLWVALYSREHALELVEDTGWKIESLNDPEQHIQHYMVCKPV